MNLKKWIFGIGLSAQALVLLVMFFLVKELRREPESEDPYAFSSPIAKVEVAPSQHAIPFTHYVAGSGKVIPSSDYIKISPSLQGIVEDVYVTVGQKVSAGDLLFKIDDSLIKCQLSEKQSEVETTKVKLEVMQKGAGAFDLLMKEKEIAQVKATCDMHQKDHELILALYEKNAVSNSELNQQTSLVNMASAQLEKILVEYDKMKAGPSDQDRKLSHALIEEKLANCKTLEKQLGDCNVRAPIDGRIFSVNIHPGEYSDALKEPAIYMGSDDPLHLRVYIDQKEAWRVTPSPHIRAIAVHRSNPKIHFLLEYVSVNPCFTDQGCLELTFAFDRNKYPVYLDETLDVYIEASSAGDNALLDYQFSQMRN